MNNYYNPYYPAHKPDHYSQTEMPCPRPTEMTAFPEKTAEAMAYVPFQLSNETYDAEKALCQGTIFPVLDKPFVGC